MFKGHVDNISSVAFSPNGENILTGSWDKTSRLWNIKETLKEFQKMNAYQELSLTQMLKYGMIIYDDVLKLEDEKSIQEAADYYLSEINLVGKDKKNEYINYALNLIDKLIINFRNDSYSQQRDSLMLMR